MSASSEPISLINDDAVSPSLRGGSLSFIETLGQSIANISPTFTPALNISVVAGLAGNASWLAYLIGTIGMLLVAGNIGILAKRHPMAGSYFVYIGRTLGPFAGLIAGWSMIAAYIVTAIAVVFGAGIFLDNMLTALGFAAFIPNRAAFYVVFTLLVGAAAYSDVRLSSRMGLVLEGVSLAIIAAITVLVLMRHGTAVDPKQFVNIKFGGVMGALAFSVFSFVGFESAASMGKEARNPTQTVPRAIMMSAILAGGFFVVIAYCMVLGVADKADVIGNSAAPFSEITKAAGLTWAGGVVYFASLISAFACTLACINASSRMVFSMSRYQFLHASAGAVSQKHQTPHIAIAASTALTILVTLLFLPADPLNAFGYTGTFATFGFLVVYMLMCVVAPVELKRAGELKAKHIILSAAGVLVMAFVIFGSLYPIPSAPYNYIPYLFGGYLLIGAVWYGVLTQRNKDITLKNAMLLDME